MFLFSLSEAIAWLNQCIHFNSPLSYFILVPGLNQQQSQYIVTLLSKTIIK